MKSRNPFSNLEETQSNELLKLLIGPLEGAEAITSANLETWAISHEKTPGSLISELTKFDGAPYTTGQDQSAWHILKPLLTYLSASLIIRIINNIIIKNTQTISPFDSDIFGNTMELISTITLIAFSSCLNHSRLRQRDQELFEARAQYLAFCLTNWQQRSRGPIYQNNPYSDLILYFETSRGDLNKIKSGLYNLNIRSDKIHTTLIPMQYLWEHAASVVSTPNIKGYLISFICFLFMCCLTEKLFTEDLDKTFSLFIESELGPIFISTSILNYLFLLPIIFGAFFKNSQNGEHKLTAFLREFEKFKPELTAIEANTKGKMASQTPNLKKPSKNSRPPVVDDGLSNGAAADIAPQSQLTAAMMWEQPGPNPRPIKTHTSSGRGDARAKHAEETRRIQAEKAQKAEARRQARGAKR